MKNIQKILCAMALYNAHSYAMESCTERGRVVLAGPHLVAQNDEGYKIIKCHNQGQSNTFATLNDLKNQLRTESNNITRQHLAKTIALHSISDDFLAVLHQNPNDPAITLEPSLHNEIYTHMNRVYAKYCDVKHEMLAIEEARFSPNDAMIATTSGNYTTYCELRLFALNGLELQKIAYHLQEPCSWFSLRRAMFSGDDATIMTIDSRMNANVALVNAATGEKRVLRGLINIEQAAFAPDNKSIVATSYDGSVMLHNLTDNPPTLLAKHNNELLRKYNKVVRSVEFSRDGTLLATASADGTAKVFDMYGQILFEDKHDEPVSSATISSDNRMFATVSDDRSVKVFQLPKTNESLEGRCILHLVFDLPPKSVAFAPNNREIIIKGSGALKVFNIDTGLPRYQIKADDFHLLQKVAISTDGNTIVAAYRCGQNGVGVVIDNESGKVVHHLPHKVSFEVADVTKTGDTIISAPGYLPGPLCITKRLSLLAKTYNKAVLKKYADWCERKRLTPNIQVTDMFNKEQ
jgi:WD40 repeat protein